jgi:rod shape-determining protein MreC
MMQLFQFLLRQKTLLLFVLLEVLSLWSVFTYNDYQHTWYFNTTNQWAASILEDVEAVKTYHRLGEVNLILASENAKLRNQIYQLTAQIQPKGEIPYYTSKAALNKYQATMAKVLVQSTNLTQNYITIDKGSRDGIQPGMAVISSTGIVGKVMSCTADLSLVISVLNTDNSISAKIKSNGELGYIKWTGIQAEVVDLLDISKYKKVVRGDTVVTSDYNAVFPPNVPIGIVAKVGLKKDGNFHDIKLMLLTNFSNLQYVYIIKNALAWQQVKLNESIPKSE